MGVLLNPPKLSFSFFLPPFPLTFQFPGVNTCKGRLERVIVRGLILFGLGVGVSAILEISLGQKRKKNNVAEEKEGYGYSPWIIWWNSVIRGELRLAAAMLGKPAVCKTLDLGI